VATLRGVAMELEDCAFPLLKEVRLGSDPYDLFDGVDYFFLLGAKPRGPGMERRDLLQENGIKFVEQGKAINRGASKDPIIFVVGNPCNTNCWIAMQHARDVSPTRFFAMTRLDENRARAQLAMRARVPVDAVGPVTIWGNHSALQVPDYVHTKIQGKPCLEVIRDHAWLEDVFVPLVQKRGATVIAARGKSSAASAAQAALYGFRSLLFPSPPGECFSVSLLSDGNPYGIQKNLIFSFPCTCLGHGQVKICGGLEWTETMKRRISMAERELLEERHTVEQLIS